MQIVVGLFILWVIVLFVGHGSWVLLRAIFNAIFQTGDHAPTQLRSTRRQSAPRQSQQQDIQASRRVLGRLREANLIDQSQATQLHRRIRDLELGQTTATIHSPRQPGEGVSPPQEPVATEPPAAIEPPVTAEQSPESAQVPVLAKLVDDPPAPVTAEVVPPAKVGSPSPVESTPAVNVLSKSQMIQSFLVDHNIRWGELVAGTLIVVCSIGLVISLWHSLINTHRVIPSLIFLGANAAIYCAGLYTLSRWRLRHTSRAVLVIATLLVPLSVLAGLAAAGKDGQSVPLNDVVTWIALAGAGLVYSVLLYRGGKALTGPGARHLAQVVAGPVYVIPLMPAATRAWGTAAGWLIAIGALAIYLAVIEMVRRRRRQTPLGVVGSRTRILVMSLAAFALGASIGYALVANGPTTRARALPIMISALPALVGLAALGRSLMISARGGIQRFVGAVSCLLLIGLSWVALPVAMIQMHWLWIWAGVLSLSGMVIGWVLKQPRWLPLSTLPVGLATMVSSPAWLAGKAWESIPWWSRLIGGEPMLAATLIALVVGVAAAVISDKDRKRWMAYAA